MSLVRVLVVEDSLTVRRYLCDVLAHDAMFDVVGEAADGREAIELCQSLRPDVISLDMMLPVMSGLAATEYIMAYCPTPILVVSSSLNRGEVFRTYEALSAGAVDAMEKPGEGEDGPAWEARYKAQLRLVSRVRAIPHPRGRLQALQPAMPAAAQQELRVIGLGTSTGGPRAIVDVLQGIPAGFALPILLVIHLGEPFAAPFADWLDGQTPHRVQLARDGMALPRTGVTMAPSNRHLLLRKGRLHLDDGPERHSCRPSVDVLFESLALECGPACACALLTGMGQDGAQGLAAVRAAGGITIAQDEASCVVYGMPREAARINAAQRILPLSEIGPALADLRRSP